MQNSADGWNWRESWRRIWFLMRREFLAIWRDKRSRTVLIMPPLIQLFIFSHAATFEVRNATLGILNEDMGLAGRELVARFTASEAFSPAVRLTTDAEIPAVIENERALAVLHIGPTFSRDLAAGRSAHVQMIVDGRHSNTALIALSYVNAIVEDFGRTQAALRNPPQPAGSVLITRAWFNPNYNSQWFIIPGIVATLAMIVATITTSLSVAREKELGTFEQLLVTPLRPLEILAGKMLPPAMLGVAEGCMLGTLGILLFGVPLRGEAIVVVLALIVFMLSVTGIGVMISSLASTQQQAMIGTFSCIMPFITLSGFMTPIENMPQWIQVATYLNPLRYMLVINRGVFLQDMPLDVVFANIWPMALIGLATASAASWLFRNRLQ